MLDFAILLVLVAVCVLLVRRVRDQGFESLRFSDTVLAAVGRVVLPDREEAEGEHQADQGLSTYAGRWPGASATLAPPAESELQAPLWDLPTAPADRPESLPSVEPGSPRFHIAWVAAFVLIVVSVVLQARLWQNRENLLPLWLLLIVGAAFAVVVRAGLRLPAVPEEGAPPVERSPLVVRPGLLSRFQFAPELQRGELWIVGCFVAEALALICFEKAQLATVGWILHVLASVLFFAGVWIASKTDLRRLAGGWTRWDTIAMLVISILGMIPRLWHLGLIPQGLWYDESMRGLDAFRMLADPSYRPIFEPSIQESAGIRYLIAPFLAVMGHDPTALRIPTAIAGVMGVPIVYALAHVLFGRRTAIVAAAVMAGLSWQINYSRIAFPTIFSMSLDALTVTFFVLGLKRANALAFAAAGITAGTAIHFYHSSQLIPFVLTALVIYHLASRRKEFVVQYWRLLGLTVIGFIVAAAPIAEYAAVHTREFTQRVNTVNVMNEVHQTGSWQPLIQSTRAHLLMFNASGDNNGRHNWTGRPMLDEVTGGLAILGFALALTHWRRWQYAVPLLWVPLFLLAGILSISWEAPQSHRTADEVTAVSLLAAVPLATLWRASDRLRPSLLPARRLVFGLLRRRNIYASGLSPVVGLAVVALLIFSGVRNVDRYFNKQQTDPRTWEEYSTVQTVAGQEINSVPATWKTYLDPFLLGYPSLLFMMNQQRDLLPYDVAANIPMTDEAATVILSQRMANAAERLMELYPNAEREILSVPGLNIPGLYTFKFSPSDIEATEGVVAQYGPADDPVRRTETKIDFAWPGTTPLPPPFAASFQSTLSIPTYGEYRFRIEGPTDATLTIDGNTVLASSGTDVQLLMPKGAHTLRLDAPEAGTSPLRLLWAPPQKEFDSIPINMLHLPKLTVTGLLGKIYPGTQPQGSPAIQEIDPNVDLQVHRLPIARPYNIEWSGSILAPETGNYRFATSSVDSSALWIDDNQIINNAVSNQTVEGMVPLTAGWHDIRVRFNDSTQFTHVELMWEAPGTGREIIPSAALRPWPASLAAQAQPGDEDVNRAKAALAAVPRAGSPAPAAGASQVSNGEPLAPPGTLDQPRGVAIAPDGTVYVADAGKKAVVALSQDGTTEPKLLAEGQLKDPSAVAVLRDRSLAVLDAGDGAIWHVDPATGSVINRLAADQGLYGPRGIAVGDDGRIAVADTGNNRILLLSPDGTNPVSVGGVREPTDVGFLPDGTLLVAETGANQITIVKTDGSRVNTWSMPKAYTVVGPHVAVLPRGGWLVTATEDHKLIRMTGNDKEPQPWAIDPALKKPVGIAASAQAVVIVDADGGGATLYRVR